MTPQPSERKLHDPARWYYRKTVLSIGSETMVGPALHRLMRIPRLIARIFNPQPNPQNPMSCTTCAAFVGSPRGLVRRCKTY